MVQTRKKSADASVPSLQELLEAGLHFGHQVKRWHPHMSQFIYGKRDNIHIIDLVKTHDQLLIAADFLRDAAAEGKVILYVGTKRQAQSIMTAEAKRAEMPYITQRWIGGLITNWEQNKRNIDKLNNYDKEKASGSLSKYTKKEQLLMERKMHKLRNELGGIQLLNKLPDLLFVIDPKKETNAVYEANKAGITTVALCDTNTNPQLVTIAIPGNDDSLKSLQLIVETITNAIVEGKALAGKAARKAAEAVGTTEEPIIANVDEVIEEVVEEVEGVVEEEAEKEVQTAPEKLEDRTLTGTSKTQSEEAKTTRKPRESKAEEKAERTDEKKIKKTAPKSAASDKQSAAKKTAGKTSRKK